MIGFSMSKKLFFIVAILSLIVQIIFPMWWAAWVISIWLFFVEGVIEMGLFTVGYWRAYTNPFLIFFWMYGLLAIYSTIRSLVLCKKYSIEDIYSTQQGKILLIINVLTIVISIVLIVVNGGFIPRL